VCAGRLLRLNTIPRGDPLNMPARRGSPFSAFIIEVLSCSAFLYLLINPPFVT
jgi:hypothetical protein